MKKKYGPLPLWAWGAVGVVAIYLWYRYSQGSSSTPATASNTGVDPVTGIPYSQEEAAYQNEAASAQVPGSGGITDPSSGTSTPSGLDLADFLTYLQQFEQATGTTLGPSTPAPPPPQQNSDGTTPPDNNSPPTTAPSTNGRISTGTLLHAGAIFAPFGSTAPPPRNGYTVVGTGNGNWQYVPDNLITAAGGYLFGSISHNAPTAPAGHHAVGLGNGLWEIVPNAARTAATAARNAAGVTFTNNNRGSHALRHPPTVRR